MNISRPIKFIWIAAFLSSAHISCKNDSTSVAGDILGQLESAIVADPSENNIKSYLEEAKSYITKNKGDKALIKPVLEKAIKVSLDHNQPFSAIGYLMPLIKDYPTDAKTSSNILELAKLMQLVKKDHVAITLYKSYLNNANNKTKEPSLDVLVSTVPNSVEAYVDTMSHSIFTNPDEFGLNKQNSLKFVDVAEAYALANRNTDQSAQYLYKAAEVSRSIRTFGKTLTLYDWMIDDYPDYEKTPTVVFLKGFLLDNEMKDLDLAKKSYEKFIDRYPDHELASHVKFLIENLGKSDEEILELITKKKANSTTEGQ